MFEKFEKLGVLMFVAGCAALHALQPELNLLDVAVSYYMNGRAGWLLSAGLIALGLSSLAMAWRLQSTTATSLPGVILLAFWGGGCIVGGIFPPDPYGSWNLPPSISGILHSVAAMVAFLSFPAAALTLRPRKPLSWIVIMLVVIFFASLAPAAIRHQPPILLGFTERLALAAFVAWRWTESPGKAISSGQAVPGQAVQ